MNSDIKIRLMYPGEEATVSNLVISTFQHDVASYYKQEGIQEFVSYASPAALKERQTGNHLAIVASKDESVVGFLELRDYNHISLLFVSLKQQHQGIGRLLVEEALRLIREHQLETSEVTVNSSPNAVEAYQRYGFRPVEEYQVKNGIGFVPMTLLLDEQGDKGYLS